MAAGAGAVWVGAGAAGAGFGAGVEAGGGVGLRGATVGVRLRAIWRGAAFAGARGAAAGVSPPSSCCSSSGVAVAVGAAVAGRPAERCGLAAR